LLLLQHCQNKMFLFFFLFLFFFINPSQQTTSLSLSFPLTSLSLTTNTASKMLYTSQLFSSSSSRKPNNSTLNKTTVPSYNYKFSFKYSMALIVNLPIGTPPQTQQMVLDTGSQLSWIQCQKKTTSNGVV